MPITAPSSVFSVTLPVKPSVTMTSALRRDEVAALDVADEALHVGEQLRRALAQRVALARLPRRSTAARSSARRRRGARGRTRGASSAHSTSHSGFGIDGRAAVDEQLQAVLAEHRERNRDRGPVHALDPAATAAARPPSSRRCCRRRPSPRPGRRAPPRRARTIDESFFVRTAAAGSSCIAMTSDAASISTRGGRRAAGQVRARSRRRGPTSRMSTSHASTAASAPATISAGARSPPIASIAITGGTSRFSLLDVEDLAASVPTAVAAHRVGEPRRAAVRAQRVCRGREPHVRRLARTGRRAAHLALRDGHGFAAPREIVRSRGQRSSDRRAAQRGSSSSVVAVAAS